MHTLTEYNRL